MKDFDRNEVERLIKTRRSIYPNMFSDEEVPKAVIDSMLENANWAPTHAMTEPWRFTVFSGEGLRKLADFQAELYKESSTASGNYDHKRFLKLASRPLLSSHIISIGMKRQESEKIPEVEEISSVASAVQNMQLTATSYGVGCYWSSGGITYLEEAKVFFDLGKSDKLLGFLCVGIPKTKWPEGRRKPIEDKVRWVD